MLTPSILSNAPLDHPVKSPVPATHADETMQASESGGFGRLLAKEMGNKPDVSQVGPADASTSVQANENSMDAAEGSEEAGVLVNRHEDTASQKNARKMKSASAISTTPQFMEFANVLPNPIAGQSPQTAAGILSVEGAYARTGHRTDTRSINGEDHEKAEDGAGMVPQGKGKAGKGEAGAPTDPLIEVPQGERELQGAAVGMISGDFARAGTGAKPDISAMTAAHRAALGIAGPSAASSAGIAAGWMAGVQDEVPATKRSTTPQSGTAIQFDMNTRKIDSNHPELSLTERFSGELARLSNASSDALTQDLISVDPASVQAGAGLSTIAAERGSAAIPVASTGSPGNFVPILEHRFGSTGWDNALGQKMLWMVSQQQQIAELSLNPPDLGPLQVVISVDNDQASAMFVSQNADVRQALEAALPRLKEMMADSGISLGNTTVSSDNSQQSTWLEGSGRQNHSGAQNGGGAPVGTSDAGRINIAGIGVSGLVDTFA